MAGLTEKPHDSVKRTIDMLTERGAISHPQIVDGMKSANGITESVYLVTKRDSYVIVAQLLAKFSAQYKVSTDRLQSAGGAGKFSGTYVHG